MLGQSKSATLALLLLFLAVVHAVPLDSQKRTLNSSLRLARDGDNLSQSTTVQTTNTIQTAVGPMLQTCTITLDPITGDNGEPLVRETKSCSISMTSSGNNASGSSGTDSSSSSSSSSSDSASSSSDSASATDSPASATQTDASASATATDSASAPATTGAVGVNGVSQIPGSALPTGATGTTAATATGASDSSQATATASPAPGGGAVSAAGFSTIDASAVATDTNAAASATPAPSGTGTAAGDLANSTASSATSAADTAQSSAASFQLPGTHLSVLPIGLGIFAGISVIALIVVGLVTYERTKYRKAFRQRKLAESGAAMGYGGMAQAA
ncbi:hypothetical protein BN946_scf184946.g31 [Trametes cinnabarina]|uniref:Mid2 domain-containing protein n=1 Tax=Pycnoporus cinnabarinus TaxID=5643 RepID=A0A060SSW6_PYCCI|nr:hypothetical protein BN946_scf184946.g31 [Trametes cinnabarina]